MEHSDRSLYGELSKVAYASTREFYREHFQKLQDPVPAMIVAPQSFGDLLLPHAHCHAIASTGVFDQQGNFHPAPENIDFSPLEEIFRERTFKMLLEREKITEERIELLRSWHHSGFNLDTSRRIQAGDRESLESLLRYIERPPVSLERFTYREDGRAHYRGKFHPGLGRDHQLVSIRCASPTRRRRVSRHARSSHRFALGCYEVRIRYYGALSTTTRRKFGWINKENKEAPKNVGIVDDEDSEFNKVKKKKWARLIAKVWLDDPELCPKYGKKMIVLAAISSPAQDDVIERISMLLFDANDADAFLG